MNSNAASTLGLCADCRHGYHSPFERFHKVAAQPDGPVLLMRCEVCGSLWQERLHDIRRVTPEQAQAAFPDFNAEV
jgi:hypothetical protein